MLTTIQASSPMPFNARRGAPIIGFAYHSLLKLDKSGKTLLKRSSNALLQQLHCLPIHQRIAFKLAKLAFLARSSATSSYLNSAVARFLPSRTLRSQDSCLLAVPRTKTVFGSRAFRVAAPTVFNSLPQDIRSTDNISTFFRLLKTFYFRNAFDPH